MTASIISGFPGVGKTHCHEYFKKSIIIRTLDSDSSDFSWLSKGVRHPDFPQNYIDHIKAKMESVDVIFVSSHKAVRDALVENSIQFMLVYPDRSLREEYMQRYLSRGNDADFVLFISAAWDDFMDEMDGQVGCEKVVLKSGQYMEYVV